MELFQTLSIDSCLWKSVRRAARMIQQTNTTLYIFLTIDPILLSIDFLGRAAGARCCLDGAGAQSSVPTLTLPGPISQDPAAHGRYLAGDEGEKIIIVISDVMVHQDGENHPRTVQHLHLQLQPQLR